METSHNEKFSFTGNELDYEIAPSVEMTKNVVKYLAIHI